MRFKSRFNFDYDFMFNILISCSSKPQNYVKRVYWGLVSDSEQGALLPGMYKKCDLSGVITHFRNNPMGNVNKVTVDKE